METRIRVLLLTLVASLASGCASMHWPWHRGARNEAAVNPASGATAAATDAAADATAAAATNGEAASASPIIEPQVERRKVKVPKIRAHDLEFGASFGEISIEDFGAQPLVTARLDYHITEDFFFEAAGGRAKGGKTSFETLNGNVQLLSDAERRFTYYNLSLGYNILPGEVFLGRNLALTSGMYLIGGVGSVKFGGDQNFSVNFGAGFRVLPSDWLAIHIDMQDLVFRSDLLGVTSLKNNLQATIGATVYF